MRTAVPARAVTVACIGLDGDEPLLVRRVGERQGKCASDGIAGCGHYRAKGLSIRLEQLDGCTRRGNTDEIGRGDVRVPWGTSDIVGGQFQSRSRGRNRCRDTGYAKRELDRDHVTYRPALSVA